MISKKDDINLRSHFVNAYLASRLNGLSTNLLVLNSTLFVLNRVAFLIISFKKKINRKSFTFLNIFC